MEKVCAVLVTYNRQICLKKVILGLKNQTQKIDKIFVFNNNSSDDTEEVLKDLGFSISSDEADPIFKSNSYVSFKSGQNLGGSGGFSNAIRMAEKFDEDYLWIMDDDVLPEPDCLERMLSEMKKQKVKASIPNRSDENYTDYVVKSLDFNSCLKYAPYTRKQPYTQELTESSYRVADMAFEGPLIAMDVVREIGAPNDGYFLEYDDSDYAQRIQKRTAIIYVTKAKLHRQLANKKNKTESKKDLYTWRTYYTYRNNIVFDQTYGKNWRVRQISPRLMLIHKTIKSVLDGYAKNNLPILFKAYSDGIHHRMGKRVEPNY